MKNEIMQRLKSPVVWLSVIAQLIVIVNLFNFAPDIFIVSGAFLLYITYVA